MGKLVGYYRGCAIYEGRYGEGGYEWDRDGWVDSKDDGGYIWAGWGADFADCCDQIDEEYDKFKIE